MILGHHGNVLQIVEVAEHAYLAKPGNTRQHGQAQVTVGTLKHTVEGLQGIAELRLQFLVPYGLQHGLVIFVHQYHHISSGLLLGGTD